MIYPRFIYPKIIAHLHKPEVTVITGMRRTGKTFLLQKLFKETSSINKALIDLENPINREMFKSLDYEEIWLNLQKKYGLASHEKTYVFLDEIQYFRELPSIMKYLVDHYKIKFVVTGSSSFYLKNLFPESLAGRKQIFELFPLTFSEFLVFKHRVKKLDYEDLSLGLLKKSDWWQKAYTSGFEEYLWFGGFPQVVLAKSQEEKTVFLKEVLYSYIEKDVKNISTFKKIDDLENLIRLLAGRVGQKMDIAKISREISLSRQTIGEYLSFLEKTYMISLVRPFSKSVDREISKTSKLYFCDTGLVNLLGHISEGSALENAVFNTLKVKYKPKAVFNFINYYQRKSGTEVDFVLDQKVAIEVKETGEERDYEKLKRICKAIGLKKYFLISKNLTKASHVIYASQL